MPGSKNRLATTYALILPVLAACFFPSRAVYGGQGAGRMLYTAPTNAFIENLSGDSVVAVNDASGTIAGVQAAINSARSANPNSILLIRLLSGATYWVGSAGLVLGSQECLLAAGATIQASNASVTVPLITINSGATNVSVAGGTLNGGGAGIYGIYAPGSAARVNLDKVVVQNCGQDCIQLNGNGGTSFDNEMTVARCDVSGSPGHSGISIWNATQTACVDNNCHNNGVGIWLGNCAYAAIANNTCESNLTGIDFNSGNDNYLANNTCNNNGTGILLDGSSTIVASCALGGNTVAGISSSGSGNIYVDNLFAAGNTTNFINGGSGDDVVAYQGTLSAAGQDYFYPPLINNQHTNTIVNGLGRYDLTDNSTGAVDAVQSEYNAAVSAHPGSVIVLHLNGAYTVGANPLALGSDTCVLLGGSIQINSATTAACAIAATNAGYLSVSGGVIDGGSTNAPKTGRNGIHFTGDSMFQLDAITLQHFGTNSTRVGGSDVVAISGGVTPRVITRCTINGGSARGIWLLNGGARAIVSDNTVAGVQMDGVDCDSQTFASLIKNNYLHNNTRYGVFVEQSASYDLILGNICNYDASYGVGCYNNSVTPRANTAYNSVICNSLLGDNGLRNGSTGTNVVLTSDNFYFDNTVMGADIVSQVYGAQNYYSQNYLGNSSVTTSGAEVFFNPPDVSSNLFLQDSGSGLAVQVQNASTADGAAIVIGQTGSLANDQWMLAPTDSGYYQLKNMYGGLDLVVQGASTNAGAVIVQWSFGSSGDDQWMPMSAGNGLYYFVNRLSGLALTVPGTVAGTQLTQQPFTGAAGQQFNLPLTLVTGGFSLGINPGSATVIASNSAVFTVNLMTNNGFGGTVTFGVSGLPANTGAAFSPASLAGDGIATLTVTTSNNTPVGAFILAVTGSSALFTNSLNVGLLVSGAALALPGTLVWTGASGAGTNWSGALNWTNITAGGYGPPGFSNILIFTNTAAVTASALTAPGSGVVIPGNVSDWVDSSFTVGGLLDYANTAGNNPIYHNIGIASGATLSVFTNLQVGGFTQFLFGDSNVTRLTVSGSGATLLVTNGGVTVSADATNGPGNNALLDLSGLDNFVLNGTQIRAGVEGGGNAHHAGGVIYLARANDLILTSAGYSDNAATGSPFSGNPGLYLGHNGSNFGNGSRMYLGIVNDIFVDYAAIGRGDTNALLAFNPAFLNDNPSAIICGTNGPGSRVGVYVVGDGSAGAQANAPATNDFTGGTVNALVNYLCVGRGRNGSNSTVGGSGVLTFSNGTINANTLAIGFVYPSGSNSPAGGVVSVNGAGTLTIVSNLFLAQAANVSGQTAFPTATLNLNGGTVQSTNIIGGGGTSTVNLNSGTLDLQAGNPFPGNLANVSTLNVGGNGAGGPALLENAAALSVSNPIVLAANGTLSGNMFIHAPGVVVNGTLSPGAPGAGAMTNSGWMTLGGGGNLAVTVQDAAAGPGIGWNFIQTGGPLGVMAAATNPFTIQLQSFDPYGSGLVVDFNNDTNYDWVILAAPGGITNFNAGQFTVDTSQFQNDLGGGYFYIHTNANSLVLSFTNNHPPAAAPLGLYRPGMTLLIPLAALATNWSDPDGDPVVFAGLVGSTNGAALGADNNFIYYTNANPVADMVLYTVQDVRTNPPAVYRAGDTQRTATGAVVLLPPPVIGSVSVNGTGLAFGGGGGLAGGGYYVLASTNLVLPAGQWLVIATNYFDINGDFDFTNPSSPAEPQTFYRLQMP